MEKGSVTVVPVRMGRTAGARLLAAQEPSNQRTTASMRGCNRWFESARAPAVPPPNLTTKIAAPRQRPTLLGGGPTEKAPHGDLAGGLSYWKPIFNVLED